MRQHLGMAEAYKEFRRGWLGVQTAPVDEETAARYGISPPHGAMVGRAFDGSPAQLAGLKAGDIILKFDGRDVKDMADLLRLIRATPAGKMVELLIMRGGEQETRTVNLGVLAEDAKPSLQPAAPATGSVLSQGVLRGATLEATLLLLAALFLTLASKEITRPEWDLEWLVTLPLPLTTLLSSRLIERVMTNTAGLFMLAPFLSVLAFQCGYVWTAPLIGIVATLVLLFVAATLQTLVDTGLRLSLSPPKLRNLHAVISILSVLPMLLAMSMGLRNNALVFGWAAALPDWATYLPPGLAVRALAATDTGSAVLWSTLMVGEIIVIVAAGYAVLLRQLQHGVVAAGAREAVARSPAVARRATADLRARPALLPPVQRRELRLLGRDRSFMAQTLLLPAIMVGTQIFINATGNVFVGAVDHPQNLAAIAFALASYTLMLSAFQTLNAEGQALWILYCVPHPLETVLRQKAKLWGVAATFYPLVIFAIAIMVARHVTLEFILDAAIVLFGVPIFAVIATALGVFGCDPLAQEVQRRIRPTYTYLYLILASLYVYAVYASTLWQRAAMLVLTGSMAIALWQKARDQFDYLLDPTASPPARVSVSDGMIAALMFFVLQALVVLLFRGAKVDVVPAQIIWIAYCAAGAVTYGVMRLVYWRSHAAGVPRLTGNGVPSALILGLVGGLAASLAGFAYIEIATSMKLLPTMRLADRSTAIWLGSLAVLAAPVFEEFVFRGLIYGGLRRSLGPGLAMLASAAIFAVVHPPLSVIPVFILGLCTAWLYERTKMLVAPMAAHALYNAAVLGFQWNLMQ
jgi:membrane protease YdiL (CAAX protease family)